MKDTFMRADKKLLEEIKKLKEHKNESYAQVVKRILDKERRLK